MRMKLLTALAAGTLALASFAGPADAAITYTFDLPVGSVGHIGGTLTTNGDLGTLDQSDILSWNFNVVGDGATDTLTDANSGVELLGTGLTATDTELSFDFDAGSSRRSITAAPTIFVSRARRGPASTASARSR